MDLRALEDSESGCVANLLVPEIASIRRGSTHHCILDRLRYYSMKYALFHVIHTPLVDMESLSMTYASYWLQLSIVIKG